MKTIAIRVTRSVAIPLAALLLLAAACAQSGDVIRIDGSPGVAPLVSALLTPYRAAYPRDSVQLATGLGSSARLAAVAENRIDLAMASHGLSDDDLKRRGLVANEIARMAVVFAVDASVPVTGLTRQQVCDVYAGTARSWRALGGPDAPIAPLTRPPAEVDAEVALAGVPCLQGLKHGASVVVVERPDSMAAVLTRTRGAFGLTSMTVVEQSGGTLRAIALDGVAPTAANVENGSYSLIRRSVLVTRATPPAGATRLLAFIRSADGAAIIRANGAVPSR